MQYDTRFDWWRGSIKLPVFDDIKINVPGRESKRSTIELRVIAEDIDPMDEQGLAYTYLVANQPKVLEACLKGIGKLAKQMRPIIEKAGWFDSDRLEELLPKSPTVDALRSRVTLYDVCITDRVKNGIAHIEYSFNAAWDQEHGQLVVLHRDRLVFSGLSGDGWGD
jgi:hypothetical protein